MKQCLFLLLCLCHSWVYASYTGSFPKHSAPSSGQDELALTALSKPVSYKGSALGVSFGPEGLGASLGYKPSDHWGIELEWRKYPENDHRYDVSNYYHGVTTDSSILTTISGDLWFLNGVYYFSPYRDNASSYLSFGFGIPMPHLSWSGDYHENLSYSLFEVREVFQASIGTEIPFERLLLGFECRLQSYDERYRLQSASEARVLSYSGSGVKSVLSAHLKYRI